MLTAGYGMMSPCQPRKSLNLILSCLVFSLVFKMSWLFPATGAASEIQLNGQVGGNVTIHCPVNTEKKIKFFYFQKGKEFVNGFYTQRNVTKGWENTRLDDINKTSVLMYNLSLTHSGEYLCIIEYSDSSKILRSGVRLRVTATYSKPDVRKSCNAFSCRVTCESYGGYPSKRMMWDIPGSSMWEEVNSSERGEPNTTMYSSSTALFNCSGVELKYLRCYVGPIKSDFFSVCAPEEPPESTYPKIIAAISVLLAVSVIVALLLICRCRRQNTGSESMTMRQTGGINGQAGEDKPLSESTKEPDGP